ncbi:hypothetical protein, partial [Pseudomonas syringae group genomosp. 7]|uniref:hypothetical protein n=1 Tax=Pseudomonas syringae group genomosp. 7 TaxID=251699 RepID=UPI003770721D
LMLYILERLLHLPGFFDPQLLPVIDLREACQLIELSFCLLGFPSDRPGLVDQGVLARPQSVAFFSHIHISQGDADLDEQIS